MDTRLINEAWRCLPKEFKKEVKAHYAGLNAAYKAYLSKDSLSNEECDRCNVLREKMALYQMYFGLHNLTSDAEGEDEMLHVSRKRVQEIYSNAITHHPCGYNHKKDLLKYLFGAKCLPDEGQFAKSANCLDPKPAEPKFKVGDKVRIISLQGKPIPDKGEADVVSHINIGNEEQMYYLENHYHCAYGFSESDLEPYTEPANEGTRQEQCVPKNAESGTHSFNHILKDGFRDHNRLHIAAILAAGMLASEVRCYPVDRALELADQLITACKKGGQDA